MEIKNHYIKVEKTARYATYGNLSDRTRYLWIVLHGSNMVCEQMLYKFKDFDPTTHYVVAPEALSRFYTNGFSGDVVAAWMTKRDRLEEIADFSAYLSKLYSTIPINYRNQTKKILLGFSQGGTTAFRWLHAVKMQFDYFIPYACWIPEDIDLKKSKTVLNSINLIYTYGTSDQYLTPERLDLLKDIINKNNLNLLIENYPGNHKIERKQLKHLFDKFII